MKVSLVSSFPSIDTTEIYWIQQINVFLALEFYSVLRVSIFHRCSTPCPGFRCVQTYRLPVLGMLSDANEHQPGRKYYCGYIYWNNYYFQLYTYIWLFGLILLIYLVAYRSGTSPILVNKNLGRVSRSRHWLGSFVRAGGLGGSA